jgi:peptide/nickel transport system substrate-binding protein
MNSHKKWTTVFALMVVVSMMLSACATPTPEVVEKLVTQVVKETVVVEGTPQVVEKEVTRVVVATPEPAAGGPKRGGALTWSRNSIPDDMDMAWNDANSNIWVMVNIFESLVRVNAEGTDVEPGLAESWTVSDDELAYTFKLRPGLKFHDGTPVTAEDVVYSLQRSYDNEGPWNWSISNADTFEVVDESTVRITLKERSAEFLAGLALFSNGVFSKAAYEAAGSPEEFFQKVLTGTGPFMVDEWVVGEYIVLKKNPYYWEMGEDGQPLPYLDEVRLTQVPEDSTRVLQVQSGDTDATDAVPFSQVAQLKDDPQANLTLWPSTQSYFIMLNHRVPPFDDVKVRQALNYAADQQALLDAVLYGNGAIATSFMPKGGPCWNPNLEGFPYNLEKAKQLLAESKYPDGHTGAKIMVPSGRVIGRDQATILQDMWAKIGINVDVEEIEGGLLSQMSRAFEHEAISGYQWTNDVVDAAQQAYWFTVDPAMRSGWVNERAVELVAEAAVELDPQKRCEMYYELQEIVNEDAILVLLYHTPFTTFISKDVNGFYQIPLGWLVFKQTWIDR